MAARVPLEVAPTTAEYFGSEYAGIESLAPTAEDLEVPTDRLIMLTQVRAELSEDHEALKASIDSSKGMMHPVSVAKMDGERLASYIGFVNEIWRVNHKLDDFSPALDGSYYLVIAGHSRTAAAQGLAEERDSVLAVPARIYSNMSNQDIIAHQLEENIHSKPSPERQAMAIVEDYYWGEREGLWSNKAEFLASPDNKISRYSLDKAIAFADLPGNIRDFVFAGTFPYSQAVELSKSMKVAEKYFAEKYPDSTAEDYASSVSDWLQVTIARIHQKKLGGNAAQQYIKACARDLETSLEEHQSKGNMSMFELQMDDERKAIRSELGELVRELAERPMRQHARAISLHLRAFPGDEGARLRGELVKNGSSYLGTIGVEATTDPVPDEQSSLLAA